LPANLLALFLTASGGEEGQKGIEGVSGHREAELSRGQLQHRSHLADRPMRQIVAEKTEKTGQPEPRNFAEKSHPLPAVGERQDSLSVLLRGVSGRPWRT
jgi:hypothetical protein